jgi:cyclophilin family peptidyl-prolyl cis-trans isomerase/protein-disulfide isomerase
VKKQSLLVVLILVLFLGACAGNPDSEAQSQLTPTVSVLALDEDGPSKEPSCQPNPPPPEPSAEDLDIYTPDPDSDWIKGPEDARVTIVEYADFQCPYCSIASSNLQTLLETYPEDVRIVYRHFPLASIHDKAILAAQAAEAAGLQGEERFWEMHDLLYETQAVWSGFTVEEFSTWVIEQAAELGLDRDQFEADLTSEPIITQAEAAWTEGQELGLTGTPTIKINSVYDAQADPWLLSAIVELIKLESRQFSECPPLIVEQDATYHATLETEHGEIVVKLLPEIAPLAVNSFIFLVENNWFDDITFHRVVPGFVAQTGDPTGTGFGEPGYAFSLEVSENVIFNRKGLVAMANSGPDTNGSQFFITYDEAPTLNGNYTIFGEVIEGMDVVENLSPRDPQRGEVLPPGDILIDITIEKKIICFPRISR